MLAEVPRRITTTCPSAPADLIDRLMAGESSPTGKLERDRARRRSDLQNAAGRDTLKRRREQDLQATAELEVLGIDPVGCLPAVDGHESSACSRIAVRSDAYPSRSPGYQRRTPSRSIAERRLGSS